MGGMGYLAQCSKVLGRVIVKPNLSSECQVSAIAAGQELCIRYRRVGR